MPKDKKYREERDLIDDLIDSYDDNICKSCDGTGTQYGHLCKDCMGKGSR